MIIKLNEALNSSSKSMRDTRSDSIGSTITVDTFVKDRVNTSSDVDAAFFGIEVPENNELVRQALSSIVVLNSSSDHQVQSLLDTHNGHLLDIGTNLLDALREAAPAQLAARVGDFNENLFYEMQGHKKDVEAIISDNQRDAIGSVLQKDIDIFETSLRRLLNHNSLTYRGSFMRTEQTVYQPAHVDYDYPVLHEHGKKLFLAFFPLTAEGTFLQLWDNSDHDNNAQTVEGKVVFIPFGRMLIVPADTIHGGGFKKGEAGNLRFHLYIELMDDDNHAEDDALLLHPMNKYTEENDRSRELCERFVDADGFDHLLGVFFDE
ncbi:hypothetical protein ACHAWO_004613 [Cyclotella atomus]|uniref:Uncharacterized protein n=1 Tax=Cyclotella atomus TaxID=382360 RepID=A0ABD3PN14_9STRA